MELAKHLKQVQLKGDTTIFQAEEESNGLMYFVIQGEVGFYRHRNNQEVLVSKAHKGDFFGEMALVNQQRRSMSARVLSSTALLGQLDQSAVEELCKHNSAFVWKLLQSMIQRLGTAEGKLHRLQERAAELSLIDQVNQLKLKRIELPALKITDFVHSVPTRTYLRGETVLSEGQESDGSMYFLLSGNLGVFTEQSNISSVRSLEAGDFFGELSMIARQPAMATVIVQSTSARIGRLDSDIFLRIARMSPKFLLLVLQNMIAKLTQREDLIDQLSALLDQY